MRGFSEELFEYQNSGFSKHTQKINEVFQLILKQLIINFLSKIRINVLYIYRPFKYTEKFLCFLQL